MSISAPTPTDDAQANRWAILALLGVAQLMVVLDATIVNVALPSAQEALHFSADNRQWIITAYALAFGSLLLLGGKLGDLFGRKWTLIAGLSGFAIASAIGGLAQSFGMLVAARALQGAFGALLAPSALGLLTVTFQGSPDRPKAFGIFSAIAAGGASVGLLLGGVLTQAISWRWSLYVNLAIAVPAAIAALRLLSSARPAHRPRLDLPGVATGSLGLFALVYGFSHAETTSWSDPLTILALAASAVLLTAFLVLERRVAHPLLPLHIVWDRARGGAFATIALAGSAVFAVFLFLTYYLQQNLGYSPLKTGLAFLPDDGDDRAHGDDGSDAGAGAYGRQANRRHRHVARHHRDAPVHAPDPARCLRHPRPAGVAAHRRRHGLHLRARVLDRDARRRAQRRRYRLCHGQHVPTGRRLGRHRPAEHDLRQCRRQLRHRSRAQRERRECRVDPRLHNRVLLGRRAVWDRPARSAARPALRWRRTSACRPSRDTERPESQPRDRLNGET